jgi:hypothetical protein
MEKPVTIEREGMTSGGSIYLLVCVVCVQVAVGKDYFSGLRATRDDDKEDKAKQDKVRLSDGGWMGFICSLIGWMIE